MTSPRDGGEVFSILSLGNYKYLVTITIDGSLLFYFSIYAQEWQYIIVGYLWTVNGELCGS